MRRLRTVCCTCVIRESQIDADYIRERTEGFDEVRAAGGGLLARAGRNADGRAAARIDGSGAAARKRANGDGADGAWCRAACHRRQQRARVHQSRARARKSRTPVQRLRDIDGAGKRTGRPRARAESRSTARLSLHSRSSGPPAHRRHLGHCPNPSFRLPANPRTSCSIRRANPTASAHCSSWAPIRWSRRRTRAMSSIAFSSSTSSSLPISFSPSPQSLPMSCCLRRNGPRKRAP